MSISRLTGFLGAALLGVAVVVLPAQAGSETAPSITAENVSSTTHHWAPSSVTVEADGTVDFSNPTGVPHGIEWVSTPGGTPACSPGVPVGNSAAASGEDWSGSCSFSKPGVYTFYCTVHGPAMSGTVTVNADGTTTTTMTTTPTGPSTTTVSTTTPPPEARSQSGILAPALPAASDLQLQALVRGASLHGSLKVSQAGAGGRLTVELLAAGVRVGELARSSLAVGTLHFAVGLDARARRALRAHGHLAVSVVVRLTPLRGESLTLTRRVTVRR